MFPDEVEFALHIREIRGDSDDGFFGGNFRAFGVYDRYCGAFRKKLRLDGRLRHYDQRYNSADSYAYAVQQVFESGARKIARRQNGGRRKQCHQQGIYGMS